jgi:hypothetical protein
MNAAHAYLREVVYKCNLRLSHMTHICISDSQSMSPPFVNLFRGGGPDNITVKSSQRNRRDRGRKNKPKEDISKTFQLEKCFSNETVLLTMRC